MDLFLIILFIVIGYFLALLVSMMHLDSKVSISSLALAVLIIYGCGIGIIVCVAKYVGELGSTLYVCCGFYAVGYWIYKGYGILNKKIKIQWGPFLTFLAYVFAVLYITLIMRVDGKEVSIQMQIFNWAKSTEKIYDSSSFQHVILNFVMFLPIGAIFPFIEEQMEKIFVPATSFGLLFSFLIETSQLILKSGICDIDDIISNTLGTAAGALIIIVYTKQKGKAGTKKRLISL